MKELVSMMEFWLVEVVEPSLNRKQGDAIGFEPLEFLQREDPTLESERKKQLFGQLMENI